MSTGAGLEVKERNSNEKLLVFVHGFLGGSDTSWLSNSGAYFPNLLERSKVFQHYDIATFDYYTKLADSFSKFKKGGKINKPISEISENLRAELSNTNKKYTSISFIAHSMGGLVVKQLIIQVNQLELLDDKLNVEQFISLAVPHNGSELALIADSLLDNPNLQELLPSSNYLWNLENSWQELTSRPKVYYIYGSNDLIVLKESAVPTGGAKSVRSLGIDSDHTEISKPKDETALVLRIILNELVEPVSDVFEPKVSRTIFKEISEYEPISPDKVQSVFQQLTHPDSKNKNMSFNSVLQNSASDKIKRSIVFVNGIPGAGKSIVARTTFEYLEFLYNKGESNLKPYLIDVMKLEKKVISGMLISDIDKQMKEYCQEILDTENTAIIIDGYDRLNDYSDRILNTLSVKMTSGLTLLFIRNYKGILEETHNIPEGIEPDYRYECGLKGNLIDRSRPDLVSDFFVSLLNTDLETTKLVVSVMMEWFFESRGNIRLFSLLYKFFIEKQSTGNETSHQFLENFIRTYLFNELENNSEVQKAILSAQELSYGILVRKEPMMPNSIEERLIKRVATQSFEMLGFLSANFICGKILSISEMSQNGTDIDAELLYVDKVYPYLINKYAKLLINKGTPSQQKFFEAIGVIYNSSSERLKAFLCYLSGRYTSTPIKNKAKKFLNHEKNRIDELRRNKFSILSPGLDDGEREFLVLHRTIYISLFYLDDPQDEQYVELIAADHSLDAINRGFHLSYYGDGDYIADDDMVSDDSELKPFPHTFKQMKEKIDEEKNLRKVNLVVYTIFSLAFSRLQNRSLFETVSESQMNELVEQVLARNDLPKFTKKFVEQFKYYYKQELPPLSESIRLIYKLKETPRAGWNLKTKEIKRHVEGAETVSEHSDFAVRLAQIYLPSTEKVNRLVGCGRLDGDYMDYDKNKIIGMLINHDIGEYLFGDKISFLKNAEDTENEKDAVRRLSMLTPCSNSHLLADPYETIFLPWKTFEKKDSTNAVIAKDIDILECLVQLVLYKQDEKNSISDYAIFKDNLEHGIRSEIVNEIRDAIIRPLIEDK